MTRVFTVYNCGTGFNRERTDELVANLASRTLGGENREWMINDGPGSAPKGKAKHSKAKTPGTWDPKTGFKKSVWFPEKKGVLSGFGWEENVEHSMEVIKAINAGSNQKIGVVNMAGWSRGAVTCHMLAHALSKDPATKSIRANIFALDPVPGPGNFGPAQTTLPGNVNRYTAVFQEDEARKIMKPTVINPSENDDIDTKIKHYAMPGAHNTGVMRLNSEVGLIAAFLAHRFLGKHGTRISAPVQLTPRDLCELYAKIRIDIDKYRKMKGSGVQRFLLGQAKRAAVSNPLKDTAYFVNPHHMSQFKKTFPAIWTAISTGQVNKTTVEPALKQLRMQAPTTYKSFEVVGMI